MFSQGSRTLNKSSYSPYKTGGPAVGSPRFSHSHGRRATLGSRAAPGIENTQHLPSPDFSPRLRSGGVGRGGYATFPAIPPAVTPNNLFGRATAFFGVRELAPAFPTADLSAVDDSPHSESPFRRAMVRSPRQLSKLENDNVRQPPSTTQRVEVFYIQFHWLTIAGQKSPAGPSFSEQDDSREQPGCIARVRFIFAVAEGEGNRVIGLQRDLVCIFCSRT